MENLVDKQFWKSRRVFITGATGLVGSALTKKLVDFGAEVTALLIRSPRDSELIISNSLEKIDVYYGDLGDSSIVEKAVIESQAEIYFHLGAQTLVSIGLLDPASTFNSNILGTINLLEAIRKFSPDVKSIVVASSDKAYGEAKYLPYDENHPIQGLGPYDVSKSCTDLLSQSYAASFNLPITITRSANIFGPGDTNWSRIVPGTFKSIFTGIQPIIRSNGNYIRDYIYVDDVIEAYLLMAQNYSKNIPGTAFNLSSDVSYSVMDIYNQICIAAVGKVIEPKILNEAHTEITSQHLTSNKIKLELGWQSRVLLQDGLRESATWYRKLLNQEFI